MCIRDRSVRVAGDELDDAVMQWVKKEFSLAIGDRTAEEIKIHMGSAWPLDEEPVSYTHLTLPTSDLV